MAITSGVLNGIDVSNWQSTSAYNPANYDFIIMKASEGVNYKDPMLDKHYDYISNSKNGKPTSKKLYGFYHYARPETGNTAEAEAKSFLNYVGHHAGNCLFILDWEGNALNQPVSWAKVWLDYVYKQTGVKPLIYLQQSQASSSKYKSIVDGDYGLWVAQYDSRSATSTVRTQPGATIWPVWAMWQYAENPIDKNYFNGSVVLFKKYCENSR